MSNSNITLFISQVRPVQFQALNWAVIAKNENGETFVYFESEWGKHTAQVVLAENKNTVTEDELKTLRQVCEVKSKKGNIYYN